MINVVLWTVGLILLGLGIGKASGPYARMRELDRLADNANRYEAWRGTSRTSGESETTGADVMRQVLRRQALIWTGVAGLGVALFIAGFAVR